MPSLQERFESKIAYCPMTGCHLWTGAIDSSGYGSFKLGFKAIGAHRVAFAMAKGVIPEDFEIDHLCRIRCCVNPDHLEAVTKTENQYRGKSFSGINHRKVNCPRCGNAFSLRKRPTGLKRYCVSCNTKK